MSASATPPASLTHFSASELDMLAKTADALSAYLGKPVLAEVVLGDDGTMRTHRIPDPTNFGWSQSTGSMANPPGCVLVNLNVLLNSSSGRPYWNREARLTCFAVAPGNGFYWSNVAY